MAIQYKSNMTVPQILEGSNKDIIANIDLLAKDFFEKTGRKLNRGCSACVMEAVLTLKHLYNMTQFRFKRPRGCYKNKKGDKVTISNSTKTDEKAIEFLKTKPERISLFSDYPSNWEELIKGEIETPEQREKRIAIEAEMNAAANDIMGGDPDEAIISELERKSLSELRAIYPEIKAVSQKDFIKKVLSK